MAHDNVREISEDLAPLCEQMLLNMFLTYTPAEIVRAREACLDSKRRINRRYDAWKAGKQ